LIKVKIFVAAALTKDNGIIGIDAAFNSVIHKNAQRMGGIAFGGAKLHIAGWANIQPAL
jgi:hypothetical protein